MAEMLTCYRHPDRETGVSCSECGRGICPDCMTFGPVGIRCPEHSGRPQGAAKVLKGVQRRSPTSAGWVAKTLIGVNVAVYLLQLAQGAPIEATRGSIYENGALYGPYVADGDWWRLLTAAFLHYGPVHLAMNMLVLYLFGPALESVVGSARFLLLYLAAGLAGSAGALLLSPEAATVGASGAIYGLFGAILLLERQGTYVFGGSVLPLLVVNLAITFFVPGISIGGHLGGLAGGALAILMLSRFGQRRVAYARNDVLGYVGLVAIGALSVAIAYWKVRGYA
ncbi:MAG: rhomboid family intramembrane serine protease [Actinobacteria bacterium]|nr:rhomboid family intramembrane serine protease [Actinomycetota bacterium]